MELCSKQVEGPDLISPKLWPGSISTAAGGNTKRAARSSGQLEPRVIPTRFSCVAWWAEKLATFIADSGRRWFVWPRLWTRRLSAPCGRNTRVPGPIEFALFRFHVGFRLTFAGRPRTSPKKRPTFNWVTGSTRISVIIRCIGTPKTADLSRSMCSPY